MGKSKAKKLRQKHLREGNRNPELSRSPFAYADMRTRTTKNKKDQLYKTKHKNRFSSSTDEGNGSFYFYLIFKYFEYKGTNFRHTFSRTCSSKNRAANRNIVID
ncbi:hypothetical protein [Litchfieldia alkalitelluris]|uniref:hypothetical protein n=1 Tax=Litchfieldia alkalitelluris TaxID=304268 RepID=UPI0038B2587D